MPQGKLILTGTIELLSPAIIGSGEGERSDLDVIKDAKGNPFIPATSFVGVLGHAIKLEGASKEELDHFWGTKESDKPEKIRQSSLICNDLLSEKYALTVRDGVKINNKKGIAEKGAKFDYEIIERGSKFNLYLEVNLDGKDDEFKKRMLATIVNLLENEKIRIGAKTNNGFGKIKLKEYKTYEFDFSKKQDAIAWFKYLHDGRLPQPVNLNVEPFKISNGQFVIDALFTIKNSLIVRSYNIDPNLPDTEHIKSGCDYVLPGSSTKGAIRARAERIVNTLSKDANIISKLFGMVDEKSKKAKKGRLLVEETILQGFPSEVQTRIKIDRFTGGTIESALLETKPLFRGKDETCFNLKITIDDYEAYEAGLMLLVLKDLWTGDLPIGGEKAIGRGVLEGKEAKVSFNGKDITIKEPESLSKEDKEVLQSFVNAFVNYGGA